MQGHGSASEVKLQLKLRETPHQSTEIIYSADIAQREQMKHRRTLKSVNLQEKLEQVIQVLKAGRTFIV